MDDFTQEVRQLTLVMVIAFLAVALSAAYWGITGDTSILTRDDNPRLFEAEAAIQRGNIYDQSTTPLVISNDDNQRDYLSPAMNSALGYSSLRYGVGGAEAAYDDILRGDTIPNINSYFSTEILHNAQVGSDIRLTFDQDLQEQVVDLLGDATGTLIIMRVPDGAILSLVSLPTYDPNMLDEEWDMLILAEGNPFFNRALQGRYQAGGTLQTPLIAVAALTNTDFDATIEDATSTLQVDDIDLSCVIQPNSTTLTLRTAYAYGCPAPFQELIENASQNTINEVIRAFRLDTPPALNGFIAELPQVTLTPSTNTVSQTTDLLGQGTTRVNPLGMATLISAIINGGNAPEPYALDAVRPPEGDWLAIPRSGRTIPYMTASTARRLRELMLNNMTVLGFSENTDTAIGGHIALAYSGDSVQTWFVGFVSQGNSQGVAIALVLENTNNPQYAAELGIQSLQIALEQAQNLPDE